MITTHLIHFFFTGPSVPPPPTPPMAPGVKHLTGHLWLYDNLLTDVNVLVSEVAEGRTSGAAKDVSGGAAAGVAKGLYTGITDRQWMVHIYDVVDGAAIGKAKFRYSIDGGLSWAVTGLVTANTPVALQDGVTFSWIPAVTGNDFAAGDRWRFKTSLPFGVVPWLDMQDRNRRFRSRNAEDAVVVSADFGTPKTVRAFVTMDHNLTSAAAVRVQGNDSPVWGTPAVDEVVTWTSPHLAKFFAGGTYRYWQMTFLDPTNPAGYIELGKPYLGDYLRLVSARRMTHRTTPRGADLPFLDELQRYGSRADGRMGYRRESVVSTGRRFPLHFTNIGEVNASALIAMRDATWSRAERLNRPLFFLPDASVPPAVYLCFLDSFRGIPGAGGHPRRHDVELEMSEVVRL